MNKFRNFFLLSAITLAVNGYAQTKASVEVVDNITYVSLESIEPLYRSANWSEDKKIFIIQRVADNNEFRLNIETGDLVWNSQTIGNVPNAKKINYSKNSFPVNVIETLTGTNAKIDKDFVIFNYDTKLQSNNNWKIFINSEFVTANVKSIGNVLLLPIESIAEKLGSKVDFIADNIIYRRLQDNAKIEINTNTGIVKVNEKIQGSVGNLFYIDHIQKIVPLNIAEILAGIIVDVNSDNNSVNISLDSRIANTAFSSKFISEEIKNTPFQLQSFGYDLNSDGFTTLKMDMYMSNYNGRINYQSGAGVFDKNGIHPSLINFQWSSYKGSSGTVGDVNLGNRQLSGINISRIQGIEYNNTTSNGDYKYSLTAGAIAQNYSEIYNQQFNDIKHNTNTYIPINYGGGAYGIRIYPKNNPYEIGLAYLNDPQLGRQWTIGTFTYKSNNFDKNLWNYYLNIDAGQLKNQLSPTEKTEGFNFQGTWSANKNYDKINLNFDGSYSGQLFEQYYQPDLQTLINNNNGIGSNPLSPLLPNIDNVGYSKLSQNSNISYKITDTIGLSYGLNYNQRKNDLNEYEYTINNLGISKSFKTGYFSLNTLIGRGNDISGQYKVNIINSVAQKNFTYLNLLGRLDYDYVSKFKSGQINAQLLPYKTEWKSINGSLNTSLNYNFAKTKVQENESISMNLNYTLNNLHNLNGWYVSGGVGTSMKLYEKNQNANYISSINGSSVLYSNKKINPFLFANASYSVSKALKFQISASYDSYGKAKIFAGISGDIDYAPARTVSNYVAEKGVLRGKVFIDDNYDGLMQETENKPITVLVSIKGTALSLNTNQTGNFTIQNLNPGLYELGVSLDNLPLGWALDENANTRFSINQEKITELNLPIRRVYGITGQVTSQLLDNEGLTVEVYSGNELVKKSLTTFGGQFSFDGLKPAQYTIKLYDNNEREYTQQVIVKDDVRKKYIFNIQE